MTHDQPAPGAHGSARDGTSPPSADAHLTGLETQLREILTDFAQLEPLIRPVTEPAMTPRLDGYRRG